MNTSLPDGTVYTETVVYTAPERYAAEAPYQIAIVELPEIGRKTVRIVGGRVRIGELVKFDSFREGVPCYRPMAETKLSDDGNK